MSQKKRLFFLKEDNIVSENKIIVLPIKTGMLICEPTDEEIENNIIYKKYLKSKIYPPELVKDSEKDTLYFENKQMCELLKNNECIKSMCSPDSFLKHLDNLILDIDFHICLTNNYLPRLESLSGNIIDLIEFSRTTSHKRWFNNYKNLIKIKKLINSLMNETFDELLEMFYDLTDMKHDKLLIKNHEHFLELIPQSVKEKVNIVGNGNQKVADPNKINIPCNNTKVVCNDINDPDFLKAHVLLELTINGSTQPIVPLTPELYKIISFAKHIFDLQKNGYKVNSLIEFPGH